MRLNHFTRYDYLPSILKEGLDTGEVCITLKHHLNAVWLSTSSSPQGHGLTGPGGDMSKHDLRIEVEINRHDKRLRRYRQWARDIGMDRAFMKLMRRAAGHGADDADWYLYFGVIKPPFVSITDTTSGEQITAVPCDAPIVRGCRAPGSALVCLADVKAGKIDLTYDLASCVAGGLKPIP